MFAGIIIVFCLFGWSSSQIYPHIPSGNPPPGGWPFVLAFEGAAFHGADSKFYGGLLADWLNPHNICVVAISYDDIVWPGGYEGQILEYAAEVAVSHTINPNRMGVIGESAGGWLASTLGLKNPNGANNVSWTVKAVANYYGPNDMTNLYLEHLKNGTPFDQVVIQDIIDFLGPYNETFYNTASPIYMVNPQSPPHFLAQGGRDRSVYYWNSNELMKALQAKGVYVEQTIIQNCTHSFSPNGVCYGRPGTWCHKDMSDPKEVHLADDMVAFFQKFL